MGLSDGRCPCGPWSGVIHSQQGGLRLGSLPPSLPPRCLQQARVSLPGSCPQASSLNLDLSGPSAPIIHLCCLSHRARQSQVSCQASYSCCPGGGVHTWNPCPGETEAEGPEWEANLGYGVSLLPTTSTPTHTHTLSQKSIVLMLPSHTAASGTQSCAFGTQ